LGHLEADAAVMQADLERHWEVLAEAVQTVLRRHGVMDAYEKLKDLTRGESVSRESLAAFIDELDLPDEAKRKLKNMTPANYTGNAEAQALQIISASGS
jgi:adenylosuccinate lyase